MKKGMEALKNAEILERERERAVFIQIGFICNAQKQEKNNIILIDKILEKIRIGYEKEIKRFLLLNNLSFLCKFNI